MNEYVREVISLLNKKELTAEEGNALYENVDLAVNTWSTRALYESFAELSATGKRRLKALACIIALAFAKERSDRGEPTWDLRKKASEAYASAHVGLFLDNFKKTREPMNPEYAAWAYGEKPPVEAWRDWRESWLSRYMMRWTNQHSTLKQASFGQFCRFLADEGVLCEVPSFPFI